MSVTPIDTKALREMLAKCWPSLPWTHESVEQADEDGREAACQVMNAAPALLDLAERAQEQAKEIERLNAGWQECLDALAIARNALAAGADERDALRSTVQQKTEQRDALKAEVERLTLQIKLMADAMKD